MAYVLIVTAPDGTETRNNPVRHFAHIAQAVALILAPHTLNGREANRMALMTTRGMSGGRTYVHTGSGYRFRTERATTADHARAQCATDDPIAGCTPHTTCPDHMPPPHTVEIMWRGTRPVTADALAHDRDYARHRGYTVHTWPDVNAAQRPVTLTRVTTQTGQTLALYETS